jgi:hypothetical protein
MSAVGSWRAENLKSLYPDRGAEKSEKMASPICFGANHRPILRNALLRIFQQETFEDPANPASKSVHAKTACRRH